jgi:hypothetical protein
MGVPPAKLTFAFGFGDEFREDLESDINCPAAEGGNFAGGGAGEIPRDLGVAAPDDVAVLGFWVASGVSDKPNMLGLVTLGFELPDM